VIKIAFETLSADGTVYVQNLSALRGRAGDWGIVLPL